MIGSERRATIRTIKSTRGKDQAVPYRTGRLVAASQAINCLATFILSLRDEIKTLTTYETSFLAPFLSLFDGFS
jgi:hypothetical protein